ERESRHAVVKHVAIPPAFFDVSRVPLQHVGFLGLAHVVVNVAKLHLPEAFERRAVGIAFFVSERVMLAVDRHPFLGRKARRDPESELETEDKRRVKFERLVSGGAMQVNRGAEDGNLNENGGDDKSDKNG